MNNYNKFTVKKLTTTLSGVYAIYIADNGHETWIDNNYNLKEGDEVEMWDYDGFCPTKITVNGITTWTEEDKKKMKVAYFNK